MAQFKVRWQGLKEAKNQFNKLEHRGKNLAPLFNDIGEEMLQSTQARFDAGKDPRGRSWQKLSPKTLNTKRRKGKSLKTLVRDVYLKETMNQQSNRQRAIVSRSHAPAWECREMVTVYAFPRRSVGTRKEKQLAFYFPKLR